MKLQKRLGTYSATLLVMNPIRDCLKLRPQFSFCVAAIYLLIFFSCERVYARSLCRDLFLTNHSKFGINELPPSRSEQPVSKIRQIFERIRGLIFGIKPDVKAEEFEIWIVQKQNEPAFYDRRQLALLAKDKIKEFLNRMKESGFVPRSPLKIVIQNSENSILVEDVSPSGDLREKWNSYADGAVIFDLSIAPIKLQLPNGALKKLNSSKSKKVYAALFTKANDLMHFFQNDFIILHELVHTTDTEQSIFNQYWREARADFLAYAFSGQSESFIPGGPNFSSSHSKQSIDLQTLELVRSMTRPTVAKVEELIPSLSQFHLNSQIISAALYDFSRVIGIDRVKALIRQIDEVSLTHRVWIDLPGTDTIFSKRDDLERFFIKTYLFRVGEVLELIIFESDLAEEQKQELKRILFNRGLIAFQGHLIF